MYHNVSVPNNFTEEKSFKIQGPIVRLKRVPRLSDLLNGTYCHLALLPKIKIFLEIEGNT